jgi:CRISPR/Cas system-associated protein Csm6
MPKPMIQTVPSAFAWVIEDAIRDAVAKVKEYEADPNLPGWMRQERDGVTLVAVLRDAEGLRGVKVSSLVQMQSAAKVA